MQPTMPFQRNSRFLRFLLVLGFLGLLVGTANFIFIWRITSATRGDKYLASLWENQGGINRRGNIRVNDLNAYERDGGQGPLPYEGRGAFSAQDVERMEKQLVFTIHQTAQRTSQQRGIVLPLFDEIAALGLSLMMELRAKDVDLPIEVPHCGDVKESIQRTLLKKKDMGIIRFYDVCELASRTTSSLDASRKIFCNSLSECHKVYRSFDIKLLAVIFSQFEEIMLLDADTLFFESPMTLWDTDKYRTTGTLFFHDRLSQADRYLGKPIRGNANVSALNHYISQFDVTPFAPLGNIKRPKATSENKIAVDLKSYSPSEHLLKSHSWNHRAGHEMDSSLVLWNKKRQPRATTILAAFVAINGIRRPPSYGDKELFFLAVELAETQYAFSDFGVGGVGCDFRDNGPGKSVICGQASHYYPVKPADARTVARTSVLYLNSDAILEYEPAKKPIYYSQARLYEVYAGSFVEHNLTQMCPFDVTGVRLSTAQVDCILLRQRFYEIAKFWIE